MQLLPVILIVASLGAAPIKARYPQAVEVYACGFERETDRNYDGWPDGWIRRRGPGFPHYLAIALSQEPSAEGQQCLRMALDGGQAQIQSPPIEIWPKASYVLEVSLRTESLIRDEAFAAITFLDENKQPLESVRLPGVRDAREWRKVRIGPVAASHTNARYAVIELGVGPASGEDLRGAALFDDVWLARLPRMLVRTNQPHNLFQPGDAAEVRCEISAFAEEHGQVVFELLDVQGQSVARHEEKLTTPAPAAAGAEQPPSRPALDSRLSALDSSVSWRPPLAGPGFYRVRVAMRAGQRQILEQELSLAVIEPRTGAVGGEFGWSLTRGDQPLALPELAQLVSRVGISWIKYPLWLSEEELARDDELVRFVEQLGTKQIEIVGLLCNPPAKLRSQLGRKDSLTAAEIFMSEPQVWYPSLEPVLTQLSMKVRWWQLGADEDASFVGDPQLSGKIAEIKKQLDRIGQDSRLGFGWNWMKEDPAVKQPPWRFVNMSTNPPLAATELARYLAHVPRGGPERWVMIEPLDSEAYDTPTRTTDLVERLLAAKRNGAQRIFATQPFSTRRGLLNDDGTPGELLCPWLTTAAALSGSKHVGRLPLPSGCANEVFARPDGDATMFIWSQTPRRETLDIGEGLQHIDLWGRGLPVRSDGSRRIIEVGRIPTLVTGIPASAVSTAMTIEFVRDRFPSVLGDAQSSGVRFQNNFPRGASGKLRLIAPEGWVVEPREFDFKLAAGEQYQAPFQVRFPYDANNGIENVQLEVQMSADRGYHFSIHRTMQLGLGDIALEATTELADNGELVVRQRLVNHTETPVSFKCDLYAANRRRLRTQVIELGRGEDVQTYRLPAGRELLGQMLWIRADEVGGQRALSRRFKAEE